MVINMFAFYNVNTETGNEIDDNQLSTDEKFTKALLVELIAGSLNAFLLPIYTYKQEDNLLQYFALPASEYRWLYISSLSSIQSIILKNSFPVLVKITLDWLRLNSNVLEEPGFVNRLQIWPAFCKLINELEPLLKSFPHEKCKNYFVLEDGAKYLYFFLDSH